MGKTKKVKTRTALENLTDAHYKYMMQLSLLRRTDDLSVLVFKLYKLVQCLTELGELPTDQNIDNDFAKMVAMSKSRGIKGAIDSNVPILNELCSFDVCVERVMHALEINIQDKYSLQRLMIACCSLQIFLLHKCQNVMFRPFPKESIKKEIVEWESLAYRLTKHTSEAIGYWIAKLKGRKSSQAGGEKSKICKPILEAVIQYLKTHPRISHLSNNAIVNNFVKDISNSPMIVNFKEIEWDISYLESEKLIYADPDAKNKILNKPASRSLTTIRKTYILKAKEEIKYIK